MNIQQIIRTNARNNRKAIIGFLQHYYLEREEGKAKNRPEQSICLFCAAKETMTNEHVLPRWVFEKDDLRTFITTTNNLSHRYNQTTIPACSNCNNNLLSELEKRILQIFLSHSEGESLDYEEIADVIRWLEILDYKYQIFSLVTKFRALKGKGIIPFLSDYSISVLDPNIDYSPSKVMSNLRTSFDRIAIKSKEARVNSLVIFKTKNKGMHFFHSNNSLIFLELPKYNLALFYFYTQTFKTPKESFEAAMEVIKMQY